MKKNDSRESSLVYSSEFGRMCSGCGKPVGACTCKKMPALPSGDGIIRIRRETGGRGGKTVTVVSGVPRDHDGVKMLAGKLKRLCGTGGTVKNGNIEIQGDHGDILMTELVRLGFRVKKAGG